MSERSKRLLIVDDDDVLRGQLERAFRRRGFEVSSAAGPPAALEAAAAFDPGLALVDLKMPDGDGLALAQALLEAHPGIRVVILTGYGSIATAIEATRLGVLNFLQKPADADDILAAFERGAAPPLSTSPEYRAPSLARAEWEHISRVLQDCGGNISEAARRLGIHRRTLQRKLEKYPPNE
jgi:two-component system response regulator RegA